MRLYSNVTSGNCYKVRLLAAHLGIPLELVEHVAAEGGFTLDEYPSILAWLDRVAAQPGHIEITD